jgi:hypothetical protein
MFEKKNGFESWGGRLLIKAGVGVQSGMGQVSAAMANPPMFNGTVNDAIVFGGKTYAVGYFTKVSEERMGFGIPVDLTNGQPLTNFDPINGQISNVIEDGAGGWYVTGDFTRVGNTNQAGFAHILSTGKIDPSWNLNPGIHGWFDKMCLLDGNLYLLVESMPSEDTSQLELHSYSTSSRNKTNGWVLFNGDSGDTPFIYVIKSAKDRIYLGGLFSSLQGESKNNLAAFDIKSGRIVSSWVGETDSIVEDMLVTEKDLIVGGNFSNANGFNRLGVAAFDLSSGSLTTWNPNLEGTYVAVNSIARIGDTIYLGGYFDKVGVSVAKNFAAVGLSDGKNKQHPFGKFDYVHKIVTKGTTLYFSGYRQRNATTWDDYWAFEQSGALTGWALNTVWGDYQMAAGNNAIFLSVSEGFLGGEDRNGLAVFDNSTGQLDGFNPNPGHVSALHLDQDTLLVANWSNKISAINLSAQTIGSWLKDTTFDGPVYAITKKGNIVYVGGTFRNVNKNILRDGLAAFAFDSGDLLSWSPKVGKKDGSMSVKTLAVSGDLILVGGRFETINSQKRENLAAIDVNGVLQAWNPSPNNEVYKIVVDKNNIYVGGQFNQITASGYSRNGFAAFDASSLDLLAWDMKLDHSSGNPPAVLGISVSNGHVYVSGFFEEVNGTPVDSVAAFKRSDWTLTPWKPNIGDSTWNSFVTAYSDRVLIGGNFATANGQIQRGLAVVAPVDVIPTAPLAPGKFVVAQRSSTTLSLQWDPSAGATSYSVKVTAPLTLVKENITTAFTQLDSLSPNTNYEVGVKACNAVGCSAFSIATTFTWAAVPGLSTTSVLGTSIGLKIDPNGNPKGTIYEFQQVDSPDGFIIKSETSDVAEGVIDHLYPDTSYFYRVYAKNLDGSLTGPSSVLTVKTGLIAKLLTKSVDRVSSTNIGASWSIDAGSSFILAASTLSANPLDSFVRVQKVVEPKGILTDLTPNTRYNLFVLPCEEDRCHDYVDLGSMTTLANVPSLMVVKSGQNNPALRIQPNGNPAGTFYVVEKSEDKGMTFVSMYEGTDPGVDLSDLPAGKIFHFRVTAKNLDGLFTSSSEVIPYESSHHSIEQTRAYPVPFRSGSETKFLTFDSFPPDSTIDIYNLNGEQVKTITPSANSYQWDVRNQEGEDVASGVYFVRVSGSGGDKTFKIVVQR